MRSTARFLAYTFAGLVCAALGMLLADAALLIMTTAANAAHR